MERQISFVIMKNSEDEIDFLEKELSLLFERTLEMEKELEVAISERE